MTASKSEIWHGTKFNLKIGDKIMKKTLSKEEALQYIIQNADIYNIPKAYIGADYLDNEKKYLL